MKITLVSPYHGGSHRAWAEGYRQHSRHDISLLTLPARFWKWRMHGGAVTLARRFKAERQQPHLILATDMLDLSTFLALTRPQTSRIPAVLYMHENQLTYPLPADGTTGPMRRQSGERDLHYAFVNYASMMSADLVLFNSQHHLTSFLAALPRYLKHFPEHNELDTIAELEAKSQVLPVGIDLARLSGAKRPATDESPAPPTVEEPPLIVWNQRWEYDKNPEDFFKALYTVADEGLPFRLALCGRRFGKQPPSFARALARLTDQIVHVGYANEERYSSLLWQATATISTAHHEFFGISLLEAIYCHTFPILPHRLSYPELIPEQFHLRCLYQNQGGLVQRLRWALTHVEEATTIAAALATAVQSYDWSQLVSAYDELFGEVGGGSTDA